MRSFLRYLWVVGGMAVLSIQCAAFVRPLSMPSSSRSTMVHAIHRQRSLPAARRATFLGAAVLERPLEEVRTLDRTQRYDEHWEVRLYNDGLNTREHVSRSLVQVTGLSEFQAYQTMMQAHEKGMAVVGRYFYEIAEMFQDALKREGIICDIVPVGSD
jgi:ATP-dependent Clp protease adaptor protein ClpS